MLEDTPEELPWCLTFDEATRDSKRSEIRRKTILIHSVHSTFYVRGEYMCNGRQKLSQQAQTAAKKLAFELSYTRLRGGSPPCSNAALVYRLRDFGASLYEVIASFWWGAIKWIQNDFNLYILTTTYIIICLNNYYSNALTL